MPRTAQPFNEADRTLHGGRAARLFFVDDQVQSIRCWPAWWFRRLPFSGPGVLHPPGTSIAKLEAITGSERKQGEANDRLIAGVIGSKPHLNAHHDTGSASVLSCYTFTLIIGSRSGISRRRRLGWLRGRRIVEVLVTLIVIRGGWGRGCG
jgi:hypothetical protein